MDSTKRIAKAVLNKSFAEAKEEVFKLLYAKSSLALDEARLEVANSVFNEAKKTTGVPAGASEDKFAAAREEIKKAGHKAKLGKGVPAGRVQEEAEQIDELSKKTLGSYVRKAASDIGRRSADAEMHDEMMGAPGTSRSELAKERKKIGQRKRGIGQAVSRLTKESTEQLDEVSPPDMEKMTGSKKTKASFAKQYGKRGKSVMYATAWKLHNKKAND